MTQAKKANMVQNQLQNLSLKLSGKTSTCTCIDQGDIQNLKSLQTLDIKP